MGNDREANKTEEYRDQLTRLPQLANAVIQTNISDQLEKLRTAPSWNQPSGRSSETLVKYRDFRIVLVLMKPGSHINDHQADGPISVQAIRGKIRVRMSDGHTTELKAGDMLALERSLKHDVEALEESAFLLTLAWPRAESAGSR